KTREYGVGQISSVVGRYFAMDRDKRWDRIEKAYRLMVFSEGRPRTDPVAAIQECYAEGVTDEFMKPIAIVDAAGKAVATIRDHDSVIFFNFRADRARETTIAFTQPDFTGFERRQKLGIRFTCMTQYDRNFDLPVAFEPQRHDMILADVMAQ